MRLFGFLLLMLLGSQVFGQTISGKVADRATGETLIGVNIVAESGVGTVTDVNGAFALKLSEGKHKITFSFIGYEKLEREVTLAKNEELKLAIKIGVETKTMDVVVVTGSQYEKTISQEMVSIDVVKEYLIENTASPDLKAAVSRVPGVTILDGQVSIRGGSGYSYGVGSRVQLVIDDIPLLTGDLQDIQWSAIPMETVEQIEVVKGASSSLYGSGAINGVINVRTGFAKDKPETEFRIYQGVYSNPKVEEARWWDKSTSPVFTGVFFSHRHRWKNFDLVVGAHGSSDLTYLQGGQRQAFRLNVKTRIKNEKVKGLSYGLNANAQYQQSGRFVLWANNQEGAYKPLSGTSSQDKYTFMNYDPWIQYVGEKAGIHTLRARYFRVERRNENFEDPSTSNVLFMDYRMQKEFKYGFMLNTGIQYQHIWSMSTLYAQSAVTDNPAIFLQAEKNFLKKITLLFGVRGEWNVVQGLGTQTSGPIFRAGANYQVAKKTNIRASFGQSFRFASIGEKYINASLGPINIFPTPDLRPERGWSAELGVKQGFRISKWNAYADVALFWMEMKDMIEYPIGIYDIDGEPRLGFKPQNVSRARVAGIELGLSGDGNIGPVPVRLYVGYTFNYPADLEDDTTQLNVNVYMQNLFTSISNPDSLQQQSILKYRIANVFKADLEFDLWKFTLGFNAEYNSFMDRIDAEFESLLPGVSDYRKLNSSGIWRIDARAFYRIGKRSTVGFIVKNATNEFFSMRPGIMEAPRSFTLQYKLTI
jgi:iron complex outermembrane receptor protein